MKNLKEYREKKGLSVIELANKVGCSRQAIYTIENGIHDPSSKLAMAIAKALNTTIEELI